MTLHLTFRGIPGDRTAFLRNAEELATAHKTYFSTREKDRKSGASIELEKLRPVLYQARKHGGSFGSDQVELYTRTATTRF